jgi:hypothetical protein
VKQNIDWWRLWCRTLGHKVSEDTREADIAAWWRTGWVALQVTTCLFIIVGVVANLLNIIHHW